MEAVVSLISVVSFSIVVVALFTLVEFSNSAAMSTELFMKKSMSSSSRWFSLIGEELFKSSRIVAFFKLVSDGFLLWLPDMLIRGGEESKGKLTELFRLLLFR